ncbi:threonine transporter [Vibrio sp. HA2012]|uniref:LysE family translocator n=1 Tax=Vibrio sp. HA2012 TaxID=1971595 RepID=UPI000C2CA604|nr:LysE family translocator [Vibrio sp. HA2012]PJC84952.1 threonine transporter [Vibrio sp. HA2012]
MNEVTILLTLATVHFLALMSPGPDFALVVQNAARYGRQTGSYIALGLSFGILTHSILSLTGVSYLVQQHPMLFTLLQFSGGSYLLYLGLSALKGLVQRRSTSESSDEGKTLHNKIRSKRHAFSRGFSTNLLNPKALIFFVSLMSSLVPADMSLTGKGIALVILFGLSLLWFSLLAWVLSAKVMQKKLHAITPYIDTVCGVLFILLGGTILWQSLLTLA